MKQIGHCLAGGQRADHGAYREAPASTKPGGDHLEGRRIDASEKGSRDEARCKRELVARSCCQRGIRESGQDRRDREVPACRYYVSEVEYRRRRCPGHEADLHDGGEPARLAWAQRPASLEL